MATHKQLMVEVPITTRGLGTSDTTTVNACFPASPIHAGEINDESIKELAQALLLDGVVNDSGHTFGEFNRDYGESAPSIADVDIGAHNLPSPYVPNPTSPGPGSFNDTDKPPAPTSDHLVNPGDQWGSGVGSSLDVKATSDAQSTGALNDFQLGSAPGA
jgi:hypothetical protein